MKNFPVDFIKIDGNFVRDLLEDKFDRAIVNSIHDVAAAMGIKTIAITSLEQSKQYPSRHPSGKKLYEIADLVLDNRVPSGDGLLKIGGNLTGAASTLSGVFLINLVATEAMKIADAKGIKLPI